jgi:hypothetical protein
VNWFRTSHGGFDGLASSAGLGGIGLLASPGRRKDMARLSQIADGFLLQLSTAQGPFWAFLASAKKWRWRRHGRIRHDHLLPGPISKNEHQKHSQGPFRRRGWSGLPVGTYTDWKAPPFTAHAGCGHEFADHERGKRGALIVGSLRHSRRQRWTGYNAIHAGPLRGR